MELSKIINSIGLLCDIAGALLIFKFGIPPLLIKIRTGKVYLNDLIESPDKIEADKKYSRRNDIGLALLILGFILQLVSNFM